MNSLSIAALLVLATAQPMRGDDTFLPCPSGQSLTAPLLRKTEPQPIFYAMLRPHPFAQKLHATSPTNNLTPVPIDPPIHRPSPTSDLPQARIDPPPLLAGGHRASRETRRASPEAGTGADRIQNSARVLNSRSSPQEPTGADSASLDTNSITADATQAATFEDFSFQYSPPLDRPLRVSGLPAFSWLRRWRLEEERGFFYSFPKDASRIALRYTDIFQARGNPDKGGHGPSIFFQFDIGKIRSAR